ncbi:Toll/interleukin-1 receptor homology (TIR) domain [Arabidopsis thaliana x Arabidopsis arenosa]|uniref:ADP-ribosyl cyclase/cyclic ADP-ribose hydrolase n=1 Tax=Arabidopsis thaliana x Arabidopsis arenosa TaxID=1240361 RepID=A0A8T2BN07_9BRAS|nr:Toll/interleukin-1 receptor homology (TIR) domain [Arabidopsis thaliana x Arabidopsis arenosa]
MLMDSSFFLTILAAAAIGFFIFLRKFRIYQENKDVSSSSTSPPSDSSSSTSPPSDSSSSTSPPSDSSSSTSPPSSLSSSTSTHHVFPSFRGEDVRRNFLSHIQKEFRRKGITPFIDNEIKRGESIGPELIKAIRESKIAIVLLSRNYASSKWCLDELVEIMECKKKFGLTVFAVFYEVDPSHVKKLTGEFGSVFEKTCKGKTKENIRRWRQAFEEVATIAGYDSRNWENEAAMIEEIVTEISKRLINSSPISGFEGLIGMGAHMEKMKQLLCLGSSDERRTVGIAGPSGIGKTTIARVLHDQISDGFQMSVFMKFKPSYARPISSDDHDVKLQLEQQFLSQLINQEDIKIRHLGTAQNFVMGKKVLIVLDGVDQLVQLLAMPKADCLGPGSQIIITTQHQKLLKAFPINHIYNVGFPPDEEALQIFCINAFGQDSPDDGFEDLAWEVTRLAGRLPLGLRVMGSRLKGMSKEEWKAELPRLRVCLNGDIYSILKYSYDALDDIDKDLFLHIACFFNAESIDHTFEDTLIKKFPNVRQGFRVLVQRSLISEERYQPMHNLLVQLGREIVRKQSNEPGKRQFLVDPRDVCEVLTDHKGSESVIGLSLEFYENVDKLNISERAFEKMSNLQFLRIFLGRWHLPQGLNNLPPNLRILHWDDYPMTCLPSKFNPEFLVKILLKGSKLEKLWEENQQPLINLKVMNLRFSKKLTELPNLSKATNLVQLDLMGCSSLIELPYYIGNATNIQSLNITDCSSLVELPSSVGNIINFQELNLNGCSSLVKLPSSIGNLVNIQALYLQECSNLVELPSSIGNIVNLQVLNLCRCSSLVELPSSIGNLTMLKYLSLKGCSKVKVLPNDITLDSLEELDVSGCSQLTSIPEISTNIESLMLCGTLIKEVPLSIKSWSRLHDVRITYCKDLEEFPHALDIITELELNDTEIEEVPTWVSGMSRLRRLVLNKCTNLVSLPQLPDSLSNLDAESCESLETLACSFPNPEVCLKFIDCWKLNEKGRDIIIQTSTSSYAILPGREIPVFFTYRATTGGSVVMKFNQRRLPTSFRFKACILLVYKGDKADYEESGSVYLTIVDKQSGREYGFEPKCLSPYLTEHLYIFEMEVKNMESREIFFEFRTHCSIWEIGECGIRIRPLLEEDTHVKSSI